MSNEEINFNREHVLLHISSFYHFGMNFEEHYKKIEIIEKALNKTHSKLVKALQEHGTHRHKRNMIWTFERLIELYQRAFIHETDYYNKYLAKKCLKQFDKNKELIKNISSIITHEEFTHYDHNILLRPYLFNFIRKCRIHPYDTYKNRRERLEKELISLILKWIQEDNELRSMIDERVQKIIGIESKEPLWHENEECPNCGKEVNQEIRAAETGFSYCSKECALEHVNENAPEGGY